MDEKVLQVGAHEGLYGVVVAGSGKDPVNIEGVGPGGAKEVKGQVLGILAGDLDQEADMRADVRGIGIGIGIGMSRAGGGRRAVDDGGVNLDVFGGEGAEEAEAGLAEHGVHGEGAEVRLGLRERCSMYVLAFSNGRWDQLRER